MTSDTTVDFRAFLLGSRIDIKGLDVADAIASSPLTMRIGQGTAFVFRYGVVVLAGVLAAEEHLTLDRVKSRVSEPLAKPEVDQLRITVSPGEGDRLGQSGAIILNDSELDRLQIVADVLSKSLVLAHYETQIAAAFDRVDPLAMELKRHGQGRRQARELVRQVGDILLTQHRVIGRVAVDDKPDVLWDRPELERLYARLVDEYELVERGGAIDRKLTLLGSTAQTLVELAQNKLSVRLEWYIIILIAIEIVLTFYDLFVRAH